MKKIALIALALVLCVSAAAAMGSKEGPATATKYFVAHQGGYIGAATVSIDADGKVTAASIEEWQGPGGWVEESMVDGKELIQAGAVVRVPDPLANLASTDPEVKGYRFYMYNLQADGVTYIWSQATLGKDGFVKPTRQYERDFEGLMGNPILAKAYVEAARADKLVNVTFKDGKVVVGKKASETVHYGHMDKANAASVYMPLAAGSIGYRYNNKATLEFFKANPLADFAAAKTTKVKVALVADKAIEPADIAVYTAATDDVYTVADVVTGATYSDFPHYSLELQAAYKLALAEARIAATK